MFNSRNVVVLVSVLLASAFAAGQTVSDAAMKPFNAKPKVTFKTNPAPPKGAQEDTFNVTVVDSKGQPIKDANVKVALVMPGMPEMGMAEMKSSVNLTWNGKEYSGKGNIGMPGTWNVTVDVMQHGKPLAKYSTKIEAK